MICTRYHGPDLYCREPKSFFNEDIRCAMTFIEVPTIHIQRHFPPSGLTNEGKTCYVNAILQILYHIPVFRWV